jgi:inorganic triphosphatase YgiF
VRERELKLSVGDTFVMPTLADPAIGVAEARELPELELGSVYHDTSDLRLARHGVTLRYRVGEQAGPRWTLKLPVGGTTGPGAEREELDFEGGPGTIPAAARSLVTAWVRHAVLVPASAMSTRRRRWLLVNDSGSAIAELAQDDVSVLDDGRVAARFRELELESRGPALDALLPIARLLQRAGAVPAAPVPKAVRALGARATAPPDIVVPAPATRPTAAHAVRAALATGLVRLLDHDPPARLGDTEAVHQMRVATRRLRSDLRTFAPLLDRAWADGLADELRWLGGLLGQVRDRDVELELLARTGSDLAPEIDPLRADLETAQAASRAELMAALGQARYLDLLDRLVEAARQPMLDVGAQRRAKRALTPLTRQAARRLLRRAARIARDDDDAAFHRVRIAAKRARYAAEAVAPFMGRRWSGYARLAGRAAALQDRLGTLQDAAVLESDARRVLASREGDAAYAFAAGQLVGRLAAVRDEVRGSYPKLVRRAARAAKAIGAR